MFLKRPVGHVEQRRERLGRKALNAEVLHDAFSDFLEKTWREMARCDTRFLIGVG
jgi:hypothetical protein